MPPQILKGRKKHRGANWVRSDGGAKMRKCPPPTNNLAPRPLLPTLHLTLTCTYNTCLLLGHHVKATVYLALQGLPFRGHRQAQDSSNRGNFIELVTLLGEFSSNALVQEAVTGSNQKFSGLSSDIQNDFIECVYLEMLAEIKNRIRNASFVSLMADETTDISNMCQLAVSVRLVHEGVTFEHLVDLVDVSENRSAEVIAEKMKESLRTVGITEDTVVIGQSYDGASNMAGKHNSVQVKLQQIWSKAYFVHCYAHKWALVVQCVSKTNKEVALFFGFIQNLTNFFRASPKRASLLSGVLPRTSATRWLSRGKSINTVCAKYEEISSVLETVLSSSEYDSATRSEAKGLRIQLKALPNVFFLLFFKRVFQLSDVLTKKLQSRNIDPEEVASKITDYRKNLLVLRSVFCFNEIYNETTTLEPDFPVIKGRKRKINEKYMTDSGYTPSQAAAVNVKEDLKNTMYEIIDTVISQLDTRFENIGKFQWVRLFQPSNFDVLKSDSFTVMNLVDQLVQYSQEWVPDKESFRNELQVLYTDASLRRALSDAKDTASLLKAMHSLDLCEALPLVSNALTAAQTIALTSVACERNFSVLRRIKTYMRSSMCQDRLKSLMTINIENDLVRKMISNHQFVDKIMDRFARMKQRHIDLLYKE